MNGKNSEKKSEKKRSQLLRYAAKEKKSVCFRPPTSPILKRRFFILGKKVNKLQFAVYKRKRREDEEN